MYNWFLQKKSKNDSRWDPQRRTKSDKTKKGEAFSNEAEKVLKKVPILTSEKEVGGTGERIVAT